MKGWKLTKPLSFTETEIDESPISDPHAKVRITKSLISLQDVLKYNGTIEVNDVVLGSSAIGVISETDNNLFGVEKGKRVFLGNAVKNHDDKELSFAGEDYDGFFRDFASLSLDNVFLLPDSVSDEDALFINHIALAIEIIDKLNINKGDYVSVIGDNSFAIILSQLLTYYQAVPIMASSSQKNFIVAKNSNVYYVLNSEQNWQKEVFTITGGRLTDKVVYVSDCNIPVIKAFIASAPNASVALTGSFTSSNTFSFAQAIRKQLEIKCISYSDKNVPTAINLLANKAINLSSLLTANADYSDCPAVFAKLNSQFEKDGIITETVVDMLK